MLFISLIKFINKIHFSKKGHILSIQNKKKVIVNVDLAMVK